MPAGAPEWSDLGHGVQVRRSRLFQMNSVVLEDGDHVTIIDPGILPSEIDDIVSVTRGAGTTTLVFTHGDWDHVLGRPWWPKARTVGHDAIAAELKRNRDAIRDRAVAAAEKAGEKFPQPFEPFRIDDSISGLRATKLGSLHAVFRDAFGHSPSMLSLHLPDLGLLIAGDMLSDIELPMLNSPPKDAIARYRRTLEALLPLAEHGAILCVIPGHGTPGVDEEVVARVRRDLGYLEALDRLAARAARSSDAASIFAGEEASFDLSPWRGDDTVDLEQIHRDNLAIARELAGA